ncbi:hypothetical protein NQ315_017295 [Exocentrus adspersus]|uniref:Heat shock protein 83 n=1 Tax=Exocentrus adspersus TaxID=1586481 RepID=A0AAV8VKK2_9CUCU|nr:hypothetical protein NQ315_017295 [Exocentrus adspersus]
MFTFCRLSTLIALRQAVTNHGRRSLYRNSNLLREVNKNSASLIQVKLLSTEASPKEDDYHNIIKNTEKAIGESTKHEFQAETRMLLDIVARSLYSDKEVFIRELISNASDALEKFRYMKVSGEEKAAKLKEDDRPLEIHISTDKHSRTLTIQDTGIGMTKEELVSNLGVIAKSGSKAFLEELKSQQSGGDNNIIGQFGVGFYSSFMVADKVEVYSRAVGEKQGYKWTSDGTGTYEIQPAEGVQFGTKIVLHLKMDCREFADEDTIKNVINKYSNFVGSPLYLNGKKANIVQPLWLADPKSVTVQQHNDFYRFISGSYDVPRYTLHYKTDVPLSIRALLYFPEGKPGLFEMSRETESGVALYTKKILIKSRADNILPKWLRFVKGVVDSEDIPLNLSRELLQNSTLIKKLRDVLTSRVVKFLQDQLKKNQQEYEKFYQDYGLFVKEGIVTNYNQAEKEEAAHLLLFESSRLESGKKITLNDYMSRATENRTIFYLAAPSRTLAESSPYYESLKNKEQEVLFCYEPYDELVLMQLQQFKGYKLVSVEKDMRDDKAANDLSNLGEDSLKRSEINDLSAWIKGKLSGKVASVNATTRLENHPCVITLFANSMVAAGLVEDPRVLLTSMNDLLVKALDKH